MTAASVASLVLALVVAAAAPRATPPNPPYMQPPAGWTSLGPPPPNAPIDYGWVSPHFRDGTPHAGDSMAAWVRPIPANATLTEQVKEATAEETQDGRTVVSSQSHATCNGNQPGWTIEFRLSAAPSVTISQVLHLAVFERHVYAIQFMHRASLPMDKTVQASIDSLCPKNGSQPRPRGRKLAAH
jgi:hypothetical protein